MASKSGWNLILMKLSSRAQTAKFANTCTRHRDRCTQSWIEKARINNISWDGMRNKIKSDYCSAGSCHWFPVPVFWKLEESYNFLLTRFWWPMRQGCSSIFVNSSTLPIFCILICSGSLRNYPPGGFPIPQEKLLWYQTRDLLQPNNNHMTKQNPWVLLMSKFFWASKLIKQMILLLNHWWNSLEVSTQRLSWRSWSN